MAATDVGLRIRGPGRCEIDVGPRTYALTAEPDAVRQLADVLTQVVPTIRRSAPVRRQLSPDDARRLEPFVKRFRDMGILLFPGEEVRLDDEPGRRLYSYICRRSEDPDRIFAGLREKCIAVSGPEEVVSVWSPLLAEQGLSVTEHGRDITEYGPGPSAPSPSGSDPALRIVVACDEAGLAAANRQLCAEATDWVPVLFGAQRVRIGPWVRVGESGCLRCHLPARPTRQAFRPAGWATFQPGCLHWAGGLVAHLALRSLLPMSAEHAWGRVTTLDVSSGEQSSVTTWRDPFCPDCAAHAPAAREWVAP
ncbi:hypothetical protein [Streptomyces sp. WM6378]|uniref:hypothetical protein n=1 Tax=Streptomyces sp. WM6378 TaxID=1415557 RepID=UPI000A58B7AA|nr:hypothetical protein [Streptomyces sp. WM6378]